MPLLRVRKGCIQNCISCKVEFGKQGSDMHKTPELNWISLVWSCSFVLYYIRSTKSNNGAIFAFEIIIIFYMEMSTTANSPFMHPHRQQWHSGGFQFLLLSRHGIFRSFRRHSLPQFLFP